MTPEDFRSWRELSGYTQQEAAIALGLSKSAVMAYEAGEQNGEGSRLHIPRIVALACAALDAGLDEWMSDALFEAMVDMTCTASNSESRG